MAEALSRPSIPGGAAVAPPGVALERSGTSVEASLQAAAADKAAGALSEIERHSQWPLLARLPLKLQVSIPVPGFRVRDLLALREGVKVASLWPSTDDVELSVGGVQLAFSEFEVVDQRMAVRLTRLA